MSKHVHPGSAPGPNDAATDARATSAPDRDTEAPADDRAAATRLAAQVARLFFAQQLSKVEIAGRLGISRFRVARLIDQALAQGLVRIEFRDAPAEDRDAARQLAERFGLDLCAVAAPGSDDTTLLGRLAGETLADLIHPEDVVGVGYGACLAAAAGAMPLRADPTISVVQLVGSSHRFGRGQAPDDIARVLAAKLGGASHLLHAPAVLGSAAARRAMLREPEIATTIREFERVSLAIVGVGVIGESANLPQRTVVEPVGVAGAEPTGLPAAETHAAAAQGATGELLLHPFDASGRFVAPQVSARIVGMASDQLRAVPRVVGVAGGAGAVGSILGALATGVISVLVTDQSAAQEILSHTSTQGTVPPGRLTDRRRMRPPPRRSMAGASQAPVRPPGLQSAAAARTPVTPPAPQSPAASPASASPRGTRHPAPENASGVARRRPTPEWRW